MRLSLRAPDHERPPVSPSRKAPRNGPTYDTLRSDPPRRTKVPLGVTMMLVVAGLVAGCIDDSPTPGLTDTGIGNDVAEADAALQTQAPTLDILDVPTTVQTPQWTLRAPNDPTAWLTIAVVNDDETTWSWEGERNNTWEVPVTLPIGRSTILVNATTEDGTVERSIDIVREVAATVQVVFRGATEEADRNDPIWIDVDAMESQPMYEGCEMQHPDFSTVHDVMVAWSRITGTEVGYADCSGYGSYVVSIAGHESPGYWCYTVNGREADQGISAQPFTPDDMVTWDDCTVTVG